MTVRPFPGGMGVVVAIVSMAIAGCLGGGPVPCANGTFCPADKVCVADGEAGCALPAAITACAGREDTEVCELPGVGTGRCANGVCVFPRCGDGRIEGDEVCDDGNRDDGDGCSAFCSSLEACGNGTRDQGEECDDGGTVDGDGCQASCTLPRCGDRVVDTARGERCDDGNVLAGDGCAADCSSSELCGNGVVDFVLGEECDDGNQADHDGCQRTCVVQRCGDGVHDVAAGEVCDDGDVESGDGCAFDCSSDEACGNGVVDFAAGEQCDDPDPDVCHADCKLPRCGDGILDTALFEGCDAGAQNANEPDAPCRANCQLPRCGDGIRDPLAGEACDDGNLIAADGCRPDCGSDETCGNGIVDAAAGETCDDGNTRTRDGCSGCQPEELIPSVISAWPVARFGHAMAYDHARDRIVLFGGTVSGVRVNDTWEWDGGRWIRQYPSVSPPAMTGSRMVYDRARHRSILFGGNALGGAQSRTWEWDGQRWLERVTSPSPPARTSVALAYDDVRERVVMFLPPPGNQTWEWDGTGWLQRTPAASPSPRTGASMAYDSLRRETVLHGGSAGSTETWRWDGDDWELAATTGPSLRAGPMAFDPTRGEIVLSSSGAGAHSYTWNGVSWSDAGAGWPAEAAGIAYHARLRLVVFFGGADDDLIPVDGMGGLSASGLQGLAMPDSPPKRLAPAAAFDPLRGVIALFGGRTEGRCPTCYLDDTWEWDGRAWSERVVAGPSARASSAMAAFPPRGRVVLVGGRTDSAAFADGWEWDGGSWSPLPITTPSPPIQHSHRLAYDVARERLLMFGGRLPSSSDELWEWDGSQWFPPPPQSPTSPSRRHNLAMGYDPVARATVVHGGSFAYTTYQSAFRWDGAAWATLPIGPSPRTGHSLVWNADRRVMTMFGESLLEGRLDLWELTATGWSEQEMVVPAQPRYRAAVVYDPIRGEFVVFGGRYWSGGVWFGGGELAEDTLSIRYEPNIAGEACTDATIDYDRDGLAGCADPDCEARCDPLCTGGMTDCAVDRPRCGDGACGAVEDCRLCPSDCGACAAEVCGDGWCDAPEDATSCAADC